MAAPGLDTSHGGRLTLREPYFLTQRFVGSKPPMNGT
jgi:hypothetical protein